jgi:intein/homing endonuclease
MFDDELDKNRIREIVKSGGSIDIAGQPVNLDVVLSLAKTIDSESVKTMTTERFVDSFCYIENKDNPGEPAVKFDLWPEQRRVLRDLDENKLTIVLKARQLGLTWLIVCYIVHQIVRFNGYRAIVISETESDSKEIIKRVGFVLRYMPGWLIISDAEVRAYEASHGKGSYRGLYYIEQTRELTVIHPAGEVSVVKAEPATQGAGRGLTGDLVFFDEWAFHRDAKEIFTAAFPTMNRAGSGKFVGISTNRRGSFFEDIWLHAEQRGFHKIFLNVFVDPSRNRDWYERTKASMGQKVQQEYPLCVVPGTRVGTEAGIIKIEDAANGLVATHGVVSATHRQPESPVATITTARGYELTGTYDHPIKLSDGSFCNLIDTDGSVVQLARPMGSSEDYTLRWTELGVGHSVTCTPDLAEWMGYFLGDGSYTHRVLDFAFDGQDTDVIERVLELTETIFGITMYTRVSGSKGGGINARKGCKELSDVLVRMGLIEPKSRGYYGRTYRVPEMVWRSSEKTRQAFLRGLFEADGSVGYKSSTSFNVRFFAKDSGFTKDVQLLLLSLGITSTRRLQIKRQNGKEYPGTEMSLRVQESVVFAESVGFIGERKNSRLEYWLDRSRNSTHANAKPLVFEDTVVSVEPCGLSPTYNLTIEGENTFDANGIYTHNTEEEALVAGENTSFPEWTETIHTCPPFKIPREWRRFAAVDNGYTDPFYWGKLAISPDGVVYLYYEFTRDEKDPQLAYSEQARKFANDLVYINEDGSYELEHLDYIVAGTDAWHEHTRDTSGKNLIDYYREGGLERESFIMASTSRTLRKATYHEYLRPLEDQNVLDENGNPTLYARLQVFSTCTTFIKYMPQLVNSERKVDVVADSKEVGIKDHGYDSCLSGDTIVNTVDGDIPIKHLVGECGEVYCLDTENSERETRKYHHVRKTRSNVPVYKVTLEDGTVIRATEDHMIFTNKGWVAVADMFEGAYAVAKVESR